MTWFRWSDHSWYRHLLRTGQVQPYPSQPRIPFFDHVFGYATSAPSFVEGHYPVTMQEVDRDGHVIPDARVERFENEAEFTAFACRVDNILPSAYWGLRFV